MKKIISLVLTLCMLLGMMVFPARAAVSPTLTIDSTTGEAGKNVFVNISLSNNTTGMKALDVVVLYDKNVMECNYVDAEKNAENKDSAWAEFIKYGKDNLYDAFTEKGIYEVCTATAVGNYKNVNVPDGYDAEKYGAVKIGYMVDTTFVDGKVGTNGFTFNGVIGVLRFKINAKAESSDSELIVLVPTYTDGDNAAIAQQVNTTNGKITINGVTPTLNAVTLDKDSVTVNGTDGATVNAAATSAQGTILTEKVNWTVNGPEGAGDNDVTIAANGTIAVGAKAKAGNYTITATPKDGSSQGEAKSATLKVTRTTSVAASLELSYPDSSKLGTEALSIPAETKVLDQFGDDFTASVEYTISPNVDDIEGVTFNTEDGSLSVEPKAAASIPLEGKTFTVTAKVSGTEISKQATITITRDEFTTEKISIVQPTDTSVVIPTANSTDASEHGKPATYQLPRIKVTNQYGIETEVDASEATWKLVTDDAQVTSSVKFSAGMMNVYTAAARAGGFSDGKTEYPLTVEATYGGKTATFTVTLKREVSVATEVTVNGSDTVAVPVLKDGVSDSVELTYTAEVKDQYDIPMSVNEVNWTVGLLSGTGTLAGVSIAEDGKLTVNSNAASNAFTADKLTLNIQAASKTQPVVSNTFRVTLTREAAKATGISNCAWTEGKNEFVVPANNSSVTNSLTVTFVDQYGCEIAAANAPTVTWSASPTTGIEVTGSGSSYTVSVSKDAAQRFSKDDRAEKTVTLTATYDGKAMTQTAELTLKLADAVVTTVQLNGDNSIMIPKTVGSVNTKTYTVTVFDQYGFELPDKAKNATYTFTAADANVTCTGYGSDNESKAGAAEVKVSYGATAKSYTLVATVESKDSTAKTIEVKDKTEDTKTLKVVQNNVVFGSKIEPTVTGKPQDSTDLVYSYEGVDGTTYDSSTVAPTNVGKYKVTVTCETADTFYTKTINFEITAKSIAGMTVTLDHDSLTYNGQNQSVTATIDNLTSNDYTVSGGTTGQNAGTYTVTVTGKGNYTGTVTKTWTITPAELTIKNVALENRAYNGQKNVTVESVTFAGLQNGESLADYTATGMMDDANAGENKDVIVTVTLENTVKNYTLKNRVFESGKVTIAKASHEKVAANMEAKYGNTATLNLATLNLPAGCSFGKISTTDADSIFDGTPSIANSTLSAKLANGAAKAGKKATITIPVSSTNYADYTIEVTVTVLAKTAQTLSAAPIAMTYGDAAKKIEVSGAVGSLSYEVTDGMDIVSVDTNGNVTAIKSGTATITITAAETSTHASGSTTVTVTIAKRPLTVKADDKTAYIGDKQPELTYTVSGLVGNDKLTTVPTLKLVHDANVDPMKQAGTYVIGFETEPAASANYELSAQTGTLTVSARPSYVGPTGNAVSVDRTENGKISVSPSYAAKGATVTITVTPDKDQELKSLEVIDQNGNSLPLTDLGNGRFSFVMPAGKVSIRSEFGEANAFVNPYDDVKPGDWYYSAVEYVTVNGLMNGTGNGFEPNLATSRAMIWTILARMSDVNTASSGEWYAVAQQWAIANGVSDGTMPNGTITREQLAAMLYRYAVSKGMVKGPATADLSVFADANSVSHYAVEAMQWAVSTGLIGGMDGKLNPQGSATRAQVATMLMRFAELEK